MAAKAVSHGWSRAVRRHQIATRHHEREGAAPTNYRAVLEHRDSELAQEITKDPYTPDFLAIDGDAQEWQFEDGLVERIIDTLRELGPGFAFVGRQVHFDVDGDAFYVDLLFFHVVQLRYFVIELKATKFDPRDAGQLGFYVALVEDRLRLPQHQPTVGMLLVVAKNESVVRYALAGTTQPIAVSRYDLSPAEQAALPTEDALARAVSIELTEAEDKEQKPEPYLYADAHELPITAEYIPDLDDVGFAAWYYRHGSRQGTRQPEHWQRMEEMRRDPCRTDSGAELN